VHITRRKKIFQVYKENGSYIQQGLGLYPIRIIWLLKESSTWRIYTASEYNDKCDPFKENIGSKEFRVYRSIGC